MRGNDTGVVKISFIMSKKSVGPVVSIGWSPSRGSAEWSQRDVVLAAKCSHRTTHACGCELPGCSLGVGDRDARGLRVSRGTHATLGHCLECQKKSRLGLDFARGRP